MADVSQNPRTGMFATVRNRRGVICSVEPTNSSPLLHLVHIEYKDDQLPSEQRLIWELEPRKTLLEPTELPGITRSDPMPEKDFDAILRASRWTAANPYLDPDDDGPLASNPISSPFHGAVQAEDFQLVPLLKAMRMPRVNLLIADDVGLGKTIEAGLIISELLLRRRIQRVLILTPASLRLQWRDEMWEKFSLSFDVVDRDETHALRRRLGMDANPWRAYNRIIASYHYLRQPDVLEQFLAACRTPDGSPHLPWDLLVVDECHNLMPSSFGEDSDLCKMVRLLAPQFENRIFLSATPHNGHTQSFTGLLEILDPVRFSQTDALKPAEKERVQQVVLRRLKSEINARTNPPRFCTRHQPQAIPLRLSKAEIALSAAFASFRASIRELMVSGEGRRRRAGNFAVEILGKRLLSCPNAFAESWRRCKEGLQEAHAASELEVDSARRILDRDTADDRESQTREATATTVVGSWLKNVAIELSAEINAIDAAITELHLDADGGNLVEQNPIADARFDALVSLIEGLLRNGGTWRDDERIVVFTEYKTTLDYLVRRLSERYPSERLLLLFGGMDDGEREQVKQAFNDPSHAVRILLATDAASEGINLQRTARYLLHFDCPWNPSKVEQRNGRIDRHGQPRDVTVHHFVSDQVQDLKFLAHVISKTHEIREDLGSANELFDEAAHRLLVEGEDLETVQAELDQRVTISRGRAAIDADNTAQPEWDGQAAGQQLQALADEIDLDPRALRDTLEAAMAIRVGYPQLQCSDAPYACAVINPSLPGWSGVIDDTVRLVTRGGRGAVPQLAFNAEPFLERVGERIVFSPRRDVLLMHLGHPMMQRALSVLTRRRFPGSGDEVSRWTVRLGGVPEGADALVLLSVEELAVNELRETFHHWVRTIGFPVVGGALGSPVPHTPAIKLREGKYTIEKNHQERARHIMEDVEPQLRAQLADHAKRMTATMTDELVKGGVRAAKQEEERYRSRQGEVSTLIAENTLSKLTREIENLKAIRRQGLLFDERAELDKIDRSIEEKHAEVSRRTHHYEEVRAQLERERERILKQLLPKRYAMSGSVQVFPVTIEIRLPENRT